MKKIIYSSLSVTTDIVIFTIEKGALKVLLITRADKPFKNKLALPGGFLHKGESSYDAALRILKDKAGVSNVYIEQLYTFEGKKRDPRGNILSITYFALVPEGSINLGNAGDVQRPFFNTVKYLPRLSFDHSQIVKYATKRLKYKLEYTSIVYSLLPKYFTLNELQKTYEIVLGKNIDKRNFRKKFLQLNIIKPTNKMLTGTRQRPAQLYRFVSNKITELKRFF